jgi:hypothetical protein
MANMEAVNTKVASPKRADVEASKVHTIKLIKRPWYEWVLWLVWVAVEVFIAQNAIASAQELEPRAATIFWMTFFVLLLAGVIVWFVRRSSLTR